MFLALQVAVDETRLKMDLGEKRYFFEILEAIAVDHSAAPLSRFYLGNVISGSKTVTE